MLVSMLSLSLLVNQVRVDWLPLPCIALIRPSQLTCLGSSQGRIQGGGGGVLWVLKNPLSGKIHYKLSRGGFRGGFGGYHQPLSSLYMLDSVCQTPL